MKHLLNLVFLCIFIIQLSSCNKSKTATEASSQNDTLQQIGISVNLAMDDQKKLDDLLDDLRQLLESAPSQKLLTDSSNNKDKNILMGKAVHILAKYVYSNKRLARPMTLDTARWSIKMAMLNSQIWDPRASAPLEGQIDNYRNFVTHHEVVSLLEIFSKYENPGINIYPIKTLKNNNFVNSSLLEITSNKVVIGTDELYDYGDAGGYKSNSKVHPCSHQYNPNVTLPTTGCR